MKAIENIIQNTIPADRCATTQRICEYYMDAKNDPFLERELLESEDWNVDEWAEKHLRYGDRVQACIIQGSDGDNLGLNVWKDRYDAQIAYAFHDFKKGLVETFLVKER